MNYLYEIDPYAIQPVYFTKLNKTKTRYTVFPGLTVVSFPASGDLATMIRNIVANTDIFQKYVTLLPPESYHMTVSGAIGYPRTKTSVEYLTTLRKQRNKVKKYFEKEPEIMNGVDHFEVLLGDMFTDSTLGIHLSMNVDTIDKITRVRDAVESIFGRKPDPDFQFHMTLGYLRSKPKGEDALIFEEELKNINEIINGLVQPMQRPQLCTYKDMTQFDPIYSVEEYDRFVRELEVTVSPYRV